MKQLLTKIRARLQNDDNLSYVQNSDIFIIENDDWRPPATVGFPAIGLKDGAITYAIETANQESDELRVHIVAYLPLTENLEESIVGNDSDIKGVIEIIQDIKTSLTSNFLDSTVDVAVPVSEEGSGLIEFEDENIQTKRLAMRYERFDL